MIEDKLSNKITHNTLLAKVINYVYNKNDGFSTDWQVTTALEITAFVVDVISQVNYNNEAANDSVRHAFDETSRNPVSLKLLKI